ncbi:MAG TPA: peroxidase-related enzyme [Balneolaceae bacterium]|nr:peroxidase-related enzyme [Balneolaceae bacterium]
MPYIKLTEELPGIAALLKDYPTTAKPLLELAQVLLRGESTLSEGERELIAAYVSGKNKCQYCQYTHGATAKHLLDVDYDFIDRVKNDEADDELSPKMNSLLNIAGKVQINGQEVSQSDISDARKHGVTDKELHDTVLIAATFCLFNRYVDGLSTTTPKDDSVYDHRGAILAEKGYGWQTDV